MRVREQLGEALRVAPVRRDAAAVEQPGGAEREGAGADRGDAGAAARGRLEARGARTPVEATRAASKPGTNTVSAAATASSPCGATTGKPLVVSIAPALGSAQRDARSVGAAAGRASRGRMRRRRGARGRRCDAPWPKSYGHCHSCHSHRDVASEKIVAMQIDILLFDGFDDLDALGPNELLRHAARAGAPFDVALVDARRRRARRHRARHDADPRPRARRAAGPRARARRRAARRQPDRRARRDRARRDPGGAGAPARRRRRVASVCTGALLLGAAGLLSGRPATTNRLALDRLRETGAEVIDERVVDDGDILTAQGVTAGMDLALWLVEREMRRGLRERAGAWGRVRADRSCVDTFER